MNTQTASDTVRTHVSKKKKTKDGKYLQQSVYLTNEGKNGKGKTIYSSKTVHETVK